MELKSIEYSQFLDMPEEWKLEKCSFGKINLIVGKNATGKSKTLNILKSLSNILTIPRTLARYFGGEYSVVFNKTNDEIKYILKYERNRVLEEILDVKGKNLLKRKNEGKGEIYFEELEKKMSFQTPENEIAALSRRDMVQHSFLEDLYNWGSNLVHFKFGSHLGKDHFALFTNKQDDLENKNLLYDTNKVTRVFKKGREKYGDPFLESIISDMDTIGYQIDSVDIQQPKSIVIEGAFSSQPVGLAVKESDLKSITDQHDMSQGMFRTISLIIQINYAQFENKHSCILIDDIGEGLDFERSCNLIKLLIEKAKNPIFQLIMATNDRFVMNIVPLEYWLIIQRKGNISNIINYENSKEIFDDFLDTGLSNFDFFSSNSFLKNDKN
ncbi:AAA family ATPase [Desulfobacter sp. UBA2225]|uniref:AAA family ATPase n=1 Tax=Desulfobacter sp. UBA2225 TaxID=1961413 RepID=UPI00257C8FE3|nr:AAA family ATPase [Desulfobacter sp. UBA2225]